MLELINVCKTFNPGTVNAKTALNDLNLTLNDGDFVTVIGGNGAGKSTMLNAIAGSFQIDSGKIVIDGTDVTGLPEHKRAALLGRVFQDPMMGTAPTMQIEENLALAARRGQHRGLKWGITKAERAEYQKRLHVIGLAAVIIGEVIFGKLFTNFGLKLLAVSIGAVIYYFVLQIVLQLGLNTNDLKLITALIVALFLAIPYWKGKMFHRKAKKEESRHA